MTIYNRSGITSRHKDWKYRAMQKDYPPIVRLRDSVLEVRMVYKDMEAVEFAAWYAKRYGVTAKAVMAILGGGSLSNETV